MNLRGTFSPTQTVFYTLSWAFRQAEAPSRAQEAKPTQVNGNLSVRVMGLQGGSTRGLKRLPENLAQEGFRGSLGAEGAQVWAGLEEDPQA